MVGKLITFPIPKPIYLEQLFWVGGSLHYQKCLFSFNSTFPETVRNKYESFLIIFKRGKRELNLNIAVVAVDLHSWTKQYQPWCSLMTIASSLLNTFMWKIIWIINVSTKTRDTISVIGHIRSVRKWQFTEVLTGLGYSPQCFFWSLLVLCP